MRALIFALSALIALSSCTELDELWGIGMDDYQPSGTVVDNYAAMYHAIKDAACVETADVFAAVVPQTEAGWFSTGLLVERGDSIFFIDQTSKIKLSISQPDSQYLGQVHLVNRFGYEKKVNLRPCNYEEQYFYVMRLSEDGGTMNGINAFFVPAGGFPSAWELGREFSLPQEGDRIIGVYYHDGQVTDPTLLDAVGNTIYGVYLLRQHGCGTDGWGIYPGSYSYSQSMACGGTTANGFSINRSWTLLDRTVCGVKQNTMGLYGNIGGGSSMDIIARVGELSWAYSTPILVSMYQDSVLVHQYQGHGQGQAADVGEVIIHLN